MCPGFREATIHSPRGPVKTSPATTMKVINTANLLIIALALTVTAVGCRKKPATVTVLPGQKGYVGDGSTSGLGDGGVAGSNPGGVAGGGVPAGGGEMSDPSRFANMTPDREALAAYTVYFDFDSAVVKSSEQGKVAAVADALNANQVNAVRIEGHCDERGTEGYNLSLGERRALALREALVGAGLSGSRIDTISYGEERPEDPNHDAVAWSKNRRGVFVLLLP